MELATSTHVVGDQHTSDVLATDFGFTAIAGINHRRSRRPSMFTLTVGSLIVLIVVVALCPEFRTDSELRLPSDALQVARIRDTTNLWLFPPAEDLALQRLNKVLHEKVMPRMNRELPGKIRKAGKDPMPVLGNGTGKFQVRNVRGMSSINITSLVAIDFVGAIEPFSATVVMTAHFEQDLTADGTLVPNAGSSLYRFTEGALNSAENVVAESPLASGFSMFSRRRGRRNSTRRGSGIWRHYLPVADVLEGAKIKMTPPKSLPFSIRFRHVHIPHAVSTGTVYLTTNNMTSLEVLETPVLYDSLDIECERGLFGQGQSYSRTLCTTLANDLAKLQKEEIQEKLSKKMKVVMQKEFNAKMPYRLPKNKYGLYYRYYVSILCIFPVCFFCCMYCYCRRVFKQSVARESGHLVRSADDSSEDAAE
eukprot:TRINITY_DN13079_c1_g6_i1.p1 TRINITY_DN13079_c1_g6~~TRINITY_DN13079_c1_g6_i1.p1  ORF type:complete len:422 (-),score=35.04 TRINITY_DN13079_c1_g6_i1:41-1306(-)